MSDHIENLILEHLHGMRGSQERIEHELREIKNSITSPEAGVTGIRHNSAHDNDKIVSLQMGLVSRHAYLVACYLRNCSDYCKYN